MSYEHNIFDLKLTKQRFQAKSLTLTKPSQQTFFVFLVQSRANRDLFHEEHQQKWSTKGNTEMRVTHGGEKKKKERKKSESRIMSSQQHRLLRHTGYWRHRERTSDWSFAEAGKLTDTMGGSFTEGLPPYLGDRLRGHPVTRSVTYKVLFLPSRAPEDSPWGSDTTSTRLLASLRGDRPNSGDPVVVVAVVVVWLWMLMRQRQKTKQCNHRQFCTGGNMLRLLPPSILLKVNLRSPSGLFLRLF